MSAATGKTLHLMVRLKMTPSSKDAITQALVACVGPTREEDGCLQYDLFEGLDEPDTLFLKEAWTSDEALAAHMRTPHFLAAKDAADAHLEGGFMGSVQLFRMHEAA